MADAPEFIKLAEKASAKAAYAIGLHYCKGESSRAPVHLIKLILILVSLAGLYAWYNNDPREALTQFNFCRKACACSLHCFLIIIAILTRRTANGAATRRPT